MPAGPPPSAVALALTVACTARPRATLGSLSVTSGTVQGTGGGTLTIGGAGTATVSGGTVSAALVLGSGNLAVSDKVKLELDISAVKAS